MEAPVEPMDIPHKALLFSGQIYAAYGMNTWCFGRSENPHLFYTNCPYRDELLLFLNINGGLKFIYSQEAGSPVLFTDDLGLVWAGEWTCGSDEFDGLLFLIGPVTYGYDTSRKLDETLSSMQYSDMLRSKMREIVQSLPVVEPLVLTSLALMLHFTLTGQILTASDCIFQAEASIEQKGGRPPDAYNESYWKQEAGLMRIIREGDLHALSEQNSNLLQGHAFDLSIHDPIRNAKDELIVFTALCARAAMQGGVPVQLTTATEQHYLTAIETAGSVTSLLNLRFTIIKDFTQRVNKIKSGPRHSKSIRECCAYVQTHLTQELTIAEIARHVGYAEYYLTKKFQKETGMKLNDYIKQQRVEYARLWLLTTDKSIQEISDELCFSNRSFFGKVFQKETGMSPAAFRNQTASGHAKDK